MIDAMSLGRHFWGLWFHSHWADGYAVFCFTLFLFSYRSLPLLGFVPRPSMYQHPEYMFVQAITTMLFSLQTSILNRHYLGDADSVENSIWQHHGTTIYTWYWNDTCYDQQPILSWIFHITTLPTCNLPTIWALTSVTVHHGPGSAVSQT